MPNSLTFAGVPAVLDFDHTVEKFVAQRWPASRWPFAQSRNDKPVTANPFQGHETLNRFRLPYPDVPAPRINEVIIPTGASRYGRGLFLFDRAGMEQIAMNVFGFNGSLESLPDKWGILADLELLRIVYDNNSLEWQMFALPPTLIDATGENQLWLLPLVDIRYQWSQIPADSKLDQGETWDDLIGRLISQTDSIVNTVSAAAEHGDPDRESFSSSVPLGVALDAIALTIGKRITFESDSVDNQIYFNNPTGLYHENVKAAGDGWLGGVVPRRALPRNVNVVYRESFDHFGQCGESSASSANIDSSSLNDSIVQIHSPWFAEYSRIRQSDDVALEESPGSLPSRFFLATRIADDLFRWGAYQYEVSIPGCPRWEIMGHDDYYSVRVGGVDNLDSISTHVRSLPPDFFPLVHLGQRPNIYVHPNEAAQFTTLEAKPDTNNWITSRIVKMDGFYSGTDIRDTLIFVSVNVCAPQLLPNTLVMAHYQCEQGWFTTLGMEILPAWEVDATLQDVLKYSDATGIADLVAIRSNFPHIGPPPGVNGDGEITFQNPWQLDGLCDSKVLLQHIEGKCKGAPCDATCRVNFSTGGGWSYDSVYTCPTGCDCPPLPTDLPNEATSRDLPCIPQNTTSRWEIRQVENRRARWIKFQYLVDTPSDITVDEYWDGEDPEACLQDIDIDYPLGTPCVDSDVVACYDPKTYRYKAVSSESAMLGPPDTIDVLNAMAFDGCGINYIIQSAKVFCAGEPDLSNTEPTLVSVEVLNSATLLAPIAECASVCRYEWNAILDPPAWEQTQTCDSGSGCTCASRTLDPPSGDDPLILEFPCDRDDGLTPRPGSLSFGSTLIDVCSSTTGSGYSIPLTACDPSDSEHY